MSAAGALLVATPAAAQIWQPYWDTEFRDVRESAGEVVLTLSFDRAGRIRYQTVDDSARAPADYTAVSGEEMFAAGDSRTIRIPIVSDDLAEGDAEEFTVEAWEDPRPDLQPIHWKVHVRIIDDDDVDDRPAQPAAARTSPTVTTVRAPGSNGSKSGPPTTAAAAVGPPTTVRPPELELELAAEELRPGSGFELPEDGVSGGIGDGLGRSTSGLAWGLGTAAMSVGAGAWVQRRRRWSPTRS